MNARLQATLRGRLLSASIFLQQDKGGWTVKRWLWYGTLILAILGCAGCGQKQESARPLVVSEPPGVLLMAGSGSNLELTRRLAAEYSRRSGQKIDIPGSIGTSGAVKAISQGAISLGLASRAITSAEQAQGIKQIHYASVGLVVAVHSSVPDTDIDMQTLVQIYAEEKTAWSNGAGIIPLLMFEGDSTNMVLQKEVPGFTVAMQKALKRKNWQILYSEGIMLETLIKTPNAIGFIDSVVYSDYPGNLRALKLNGVEVNSESLQTGRYPLKKDLYFLYKGALSDAAKGFIDFCFSDAGRRIILASQAVPPSAGEHTR